MVKRGLYRPRLTQSEFEKRARAKQGDRFNYISDYTQSRQPVRCQCTECDFISNHRADSLMWNNVECPHCAEQVWYYDEYVEKVQALHGDKFAVRKPLSGLIQIGDVVFFHCPTHGPFQKKAGLFLRQAGGCSKCSNDQWTDAQIQQHLTANWGNTYTTTDKFKSVHKTMRFYCTIHETYSDSIVNNVLHGHRPCRACGFKFRRPKGYLKKQVNPSPRS